VDIRIRIVKMISRNPPAIPPKTPNSPWKSLGNFPTPFNNNPKINVHIKISKITIINIVYTSFHYQTCKKKRPCGLRN